MIEKTFRAVYATPFAAAGGWLLYTATREFWTAHQAADGTLQWTFAEYADGPDPQLLVGGGIVLTVVGVLLLVVAWWIWRRRPQETSTQTSPSTSPEEPANR